MGALLEVLDGVTSRLDCSSSRICTEGDLAGAGGMTKPSLMTPDLDDLWFAFL